MFCPKYGSRLYPDDEKYVSSTGVCGYCVTYDATPEKRYRALYNESIAKAAAERKRQQRNRARRLRDAAYRDCGMVKVRGNLGGTYWE